MESDETRIGRRRRHNRRVATSVLFSPLTIRGVTCFRNRVVVSPMCQYLSVDGYTTDWHLVHLGSRAVGGAAAVLTEASAVLPEGRISPDDLGIWKDDHVEMLARDLPFRRGAGGRPGDAACARGTEGKHERAMEGGKPFPPPRADGSRSVAERHAVQRGVPGARSARLRPGSAGRFAPSPTRRGARRGRRADHRAPRRPRVPAARVPVAAEQPARDDRTAGASTIAPASSGRRWRRSARDLPDGDALFVRISGTDWAEGGWTVEDSVALARQLKPLGADVCDCSRAAWCRMRVFRSAPGTRCRLPNASAGQTGMPTAAVGLITAPEQAEQIVRSGQADLIVMARELLRDPYWPLHAAAALPAGAPVSAAVPQGVLNSCRSSDPSDPVDLRTSAPLHFSTPGTSA